MWLRRSRLTKQSGQREETVSGTVRRQDVKVEEVDQQVGFFQEVMKLENSCRKTQLRS